MLSFILISITTILAGVPHARAQQPGFPFAGVMTAATIASASTQGRIAFQLAAGLVTQQNGRQSCYIEYNGTGTLAVPSTPQSQGYVFFGPTAPTVTSSSFILVPYQFLTCENWNGETDTNAVWVASTVTSGIFVIKVK